MGATTTYVPAAKGVEVLITEGATIPEAVGARYVHGDLVDPFRVANATLRDLAKGRTASGRASANSRKAKAELARRALNAKAGKVSR